VRVRIILFWWSQKGEGRALNARMGTSLLRRSYLCRVDTSVNEQKVANAIPYRL
jgi:hypothetical protein